MKIRLRKAKHSDCELLFNWVNDPTVRQSAFNQELIEFPKHKAWLNSKLLSSNTQIFIGELHETAIGQVRFEITDSNAEIDVSIASTHRRLNLAYKLIKMSCSAIFKMHPTIEQVVAHIKKDNQASIKTFEKAGFSSPISTTHNGFRCVVMTLKRQVITV